MKRLTGKIAVVTGAGQGIGKAIAKRLLDEGAKVALLDLDKKLVDDVANELSPTSAKGFLCNVADREAVKTAFADVESTLGPVDILINNAGVTRDAMFHKMDDEQWDTVLAVNLTGAANCCKAVAAGMRERNYGKIVNLASVSAFGNIGQTNYAAAKAGLIGFTKSLAKEMARNNCTVNCIAPSYVDTEMLRQVPDKVMERFLAAIPMGRLGTVEEMAGVAAFLASDDSNFVTGECIVCSGGSYM